MVTEVDHRLCADLQNNNNKFEERLHKSYELLNTEISSMKVFYDDRMKDVVRKLQAFQAETEGCAKTTEIKDLEQQLVAMKATNEDNQEIICRVCREVKDKMGE